jgi:hypothetical protein
MTGHARLSFLCAALVVGALALASSAQAGWSESVTVARSLAMRPALAGSPSKGAAVAWLGDNPNVLTARRIGPRGGLGPVKAFSSPLTDFFVAPKVAIAESGAMVMVWSSFEFDWDTGEGTSTLFARRMSARGKLGPIRTIARLPDDGEEGVGEQVAIDAAGNATIVWHRIVTATTGLPHGEYWVSARVRVRRFDADGSLGPVLGIPNQGGFDSSPQLAVEPSGRGVIAWARSADGWYGVRSLLFDRDGELAAAQDVSDPGVNRSGQGPAVAMDVRGKATIAWLSRDAQGAQVVAARQLSRRGLGPLQQLTPAVDAFGPVVAVDAAGTATIAWREVATPAEGTANRIGARQIRPSGAPGPLYELSSVAGETSEPVLAADGLGNATVLWIVRAPSHEESGSLKARRISRAGRLGRLRTLAGDFPGSPAVVGDARGVVTAAWGADLDGTRVIQASRFVPGR